MSMREKLNFPVVHGVQAIHRSLIKEQKLLFNLIALFFVLGYTLDLVLNFETLPKTLISGDIFALTIIVFSYLLFYFDSISFRTSFLIIVYSSVSILIASYFYLLLHHRFGINIILQDFVTIPVLIFSMGFIVNKRNMLFLGAIYMFGYPILMYFSGQPQLQQSALFMAVMILGATIGTTIFINSLEKSLETNEEYSQKIRAQKERLEKLNNERIRLLSIIAHDLRNPIGNIMNVVNFLLEEETTEAEKEKLLDIINKQNRKTYELLENLLLWSRSEQQLITPKFEKLNLREILQSVLSFFTESFRVKRIREFNTVNEKLFVHADKNMLEAILRNLLSNALKFSEDGSKIEIEAHEKGDNVVLAIRDYGIGMDEKTATRLFDSDFSDTRPGTKYESGAGFGMKLVKDLVRKNKGKIRVESTPGEGTVFYVTLPK